MSDVIYLYGFVPAGAPTPPAGLTGLEDRAVALVEAGGVQAVVSELPGEGYSAQHIEALLQDLPWVAERGLAHERVVAWFVDAAEILPAPLFTLYSSRAALVQAVGARGAEVRAQLERLSGRREWDLKVGYRRDELERHAGTVSEEVRALDAEIAEAAPGRRFLLERKRAEVVKRELGAAARAVAQQLLEEVRPLAEAAVALSPPRDAAELPVLLAAALLLRREAEPDARLLVQQRADALARLGFSVEFTGPWAPYRFLEAATAGG